MTDSIAIVVIGLMSVLTWAVTRTALREHSTLNNPVIPVCVAAISFVGLMWMREQVAEIVAPLYAVLPVVLLLLLILAAVCGRRVFSNSPHSEEARKTQGASDCEADRVQETNNRKTGKPAKGEQSWPR